MLVVIVTVNPIGHSGGLELLFSNQKEHTVDIPTTDGTVRPDT